MGHATSQLSPASFLTQRDSFNLVCPTCWKAKRSCLVWNREAGAYDYRVRALNPGEFLIFTNHSEIGPVRIIVKHSVVHGVEVAVLAENVVCAAGTLIITGWSSQSLRKYGSRIPGRVRAGKRGGWRNPRRSGHRPPPPTERRSPMPLEFRVDHLTLWLHLLIEPLPKQPVEFLKLIAVLARRVSEGDAFGDLISAYGAELAEFLELPRECDEKERAR